MWSVGVILYLMMYLEHPFAGDYLMIIAGSILRGEVKEPPIEMKNNYSPELRGILSSLFHNVFTLILIYFYSSLFPESIRSSVSLSCSLITAQN
jgi:hypothetical protein